MHIIPKYISNMYLIFGVCNIKTEPLCLACIMHCVTKATPIQFINSNKLKSCRMGLSNHTQPISHHINPQIINALGRRHTHTQTYGTQNKKNIFKKPGMSNLPPCMLGLNLNFDVLQNYCYSSSKM